jgi:CubicO group peptidase (beta-lactamase class C family)
MLNLTREFKAFAYQPLDETYWARSNIMITVSPESVGLSQSRLNRINELTDSYISKGKLAGTITMVARKGQVAHFECHGMMNVEEAQSMQEEAIFRLYSMTKPITSVGAMILYEKGCFQLSTPVSRFIPEFKNLEVFESGTATSYKTKKPEREMNMCDLLTHMSGLTYGAFADTAVDEMYKNAKITMAQDETLQDFIAKIAKMPLLFSPGTKFNYSYSTDVLGHIIEVISGEKLDVFLKKEIFDPLSMNDTDFYVPPEKQNRFTAMYTHKSAVPQEILQDFPNKSIFPTDVIKTDVTKAVLYLKPPNKLLGGAGLVSTVSDFLKFATMLLNKGITNDRVLLSPKTIDLMTMNHLPGDLESLSLMKTPFAQPGVGFGLGFAVLLDPAKAKTIGTPGEYYWSGAAHTSFFIDPKEEMIAILLTQVLPPAVYDIQKQFRTAVYQSIIESLYE